MVQVPLPLWPGISWSAPADRTDGPRVLGINPWIYDFAAYNLWQRPVGLLSCLETLRNSGCRIALLDCLDPTWRDIRWRKIKPDGTGNFPKTPLPLPGVLAHEPRQYSRYGLPYEAVAGALQRLDPAPDVVLVTCQMTYWYPGAVAAMRLARQVFPHARLVLGGAYATLCTGHAQELDLADLVISGPFEVSENWRNFWKLLSVSERRLPENAGFGLALDLYSAPAYAPLMGSRGCPFDCAYCASHELYDHFATKPAALTWFEFRREYDKGVRDFAFFDDALLVQPEKWLRSFLKRIIESGMDVRLHTPNALHVRLLTPEICRLLYGAGLTTIRLGLETTLFSDRPDSKLTKSQWRQGLANMLKAGFQVQQIGVYVLFGLPGQGFEELRQTLAEVRSLGLKPYISHYTPIPGSRLFTKAQAYSPYPLGEEPLYQNNSIWPCVSGGFSWERRSEISRMLK